MVENSFFPGFILSYNKYFFTQVQYGWIFLRVKAYKTYKYPAVLYDYLCNNLYLFYVVFILVYVILFYSNSVALYFILLYHLCIATVAHHFPRDK